MNIIFSLINNFYFHYISYLRIDVLLLYDITNYYRKMVLKTYHHDPVYFPSLSSLTYSIMLDFSQESFQIMSDISMINLINKNIRAGLSFGTTTFAEANNPFTKNFNENKEIISILPFDVRIKKFFKFIFLN